MEEKLKQRYICSLSFFTSCFIILCIICFIHVFVKDELDSQYIIQNFTVPIQDFVAEKAEKLSYMISVVLYPIVFFFSYLFFKKNIHNFSEKFFRTILISEILIGLILVPVCIVYSIVTITVFFYDFNSFILPIIGLIIATTVLIVYRKYKSIRQIIEYILYAILGVYIFSAFQMYNTPTYTTIANSSDIHHFEAYFYPVYKTISGLTPGIDFKNLYGFYPYIYSLFFNIDNISIPRFSFLNACLVGTILVLLAYIMFSTMKNKILAFLIYSTCLYFSLLTSLHTYKRYFSLYYLQYLPHRIFFVILISALICLYISLKNEGIKKFLKVIGYIICAISLIWNLESGIATLVGWCGLHFYLNFNKSERFKEILKIGISGITTIVSTFATILIITYLHSGKIINPLGLFFGQFIFYQKGFFMLKMNIFEQPFLLVIAIYLISMGKSIKSLIENNISKNDILNFTFSIIGFGLFTYFQGRSHVLCITGCSWIMYVLVGLLIDEYYSKYLYYKNLEKKNDIIDFLKKTTLIKFLLYFIALVTISVYSIPNLIFEPLKLHKISNKIAKNSLQMKNLKILDSNENYDFITEDASFYYIKFHKPNNLPFSGMTDFFFKSDYQKLKKYLEKSPNKLVIDENNILRLKNNLGNDYIKKNYTLEKYNDFIYVYQRKILNTK